MPMNAPNTQRYPSSTAKHVDIDPSRAWSLRGHVRIIDVRRSVDLGGALGHVPTSELIPLGDLPQQAASWDRNEPVLVVSRSGARSTTAASWLTARGFQYVMTMAGGMLAYQQQGLPAARLERAS